jgi:hypothetical protein
MIEYRKLAIERKIDVQYLPPDEEKEMFEEWKLKKYKTLY